MNDPQGDTLTIFVTTRSIHDIVWHRKIANGYGEFADCLCQVASSIAVDRWPKKRSFAWWRLSQARTRPGGMALP
jgi:hypothetical protein